MTNLSKFWPQKSEVQKICSRLAERLPDPLLLAIHTPMVFLNKEPNQVLEYDEENIKKINQEDLLNDFLTNSQAEQEGFCFRIITGSSGSGKSHYVKWVKAQLTRMKSPHHIVWISKSDSLRKIFETIFEPFKNDPEYARLLKDIHQAHSDIVSKRSGEIFGNGLRDALSIAREENKQEKERIADLIKEVDGQDKLELKEKRTFHYKAEKYYQELRHLFGEMSDDYEKEDGIFHRIFQRALKGNTSNDDEQLDSFKLEDLSEILDKKYETSDLEAYSQRVNDFYTKELIRGDGEGYQFAIDLLNKSTVKNNAIKQAFTLNSIFSGGKTFQDIFIEIRKKLFKQKKELIFLVEDFRAMSGIQEELLPFFVQDYPDEKSKEELCLVRTMVAVTEEYFRGRDTYLSRAFGVREISKKVDKNTDAYSRTENLIGKYLNAMRWGSDHIESAFSEFTQRDLPKDWLGKFEKTESTNIEFDLLSKFETCGDGEYSLFPFNKNVVRSMVDYHLKEGDQLNFLPRNVVMYMLREPLEDFRPQYENNNFPNMDFGGWHKKPHPDVQKEIERLPINLTERSKLERLICHWGGNPSSVKAINLPKEVSEVFGVQDIHNLLDGVGTIIETPPPGGGNKTPPLPPDPKPPTPTPLQQNYPVDLKKLIDNLEIWQNGEGQLQQNEGLEIRNITLKMMDAFYDSNYLKQIKPKITQRNLDICNSRFTPSDKDKVFLATEENVGVRFLHFRAMARFYYLVLKKHQIDYPEKNDDQNYIQNYLEEIFLQYEKISERQYTEVFQDVIYILRVQAQILGNQVSNGKDQSQVLVGCLSESKTQQFQSELNDVDLSQWNEVVNETLIRNEELKNIIQSLLGFGIGDKVNKGFNFNKMSQSVPVEKIDSKRFLNYQYFQELDKNKWTSYLEKLKERNLEKIIEKTRARLVDIKLDTKKIGFVEEDEKEVPLEESFSELLDVCQGIVNLLPEDHQLIDQTKESVKKFDQLPIDQIFNDLEKIEKIQTIELKRDLTLFGEINLQEIGNFNTGLRFLIKFMDQLERQLVSKEQVAGISEEKEFKDKLEENMKILGRNISELFVGN